MGLLDAGGTSNFLFSPKTTKYSQLRVSDHEYGKSYISRTRHNL